MVKTPRTRHSKTSREPMTIDLEAEAIKRGQDAAEEPVTSTDDSAPSDRSVEAAPEAQTSSGKSAFAGDADTTEAQSSGADRPDMPGEGRPDAEAPDQPMNAPEETSGRERRGGGFGGALAGGILGALLTLGLGGALLWAGIVPVPHSSESDPAVQDLQQQVAALQGELSDVRQNAPGGPSPEALEQALAEPRQQISELRDTVTALQQSTSPGDAGAELERLAQQLAALESRVGSAAGESGGDASELTQRITDLEGRIEPAIEAASTAQQTSAATSQRLDELVQQVTRLSEQVAKQDEGPQLALIVAASSLRSAVEQGSPFANELETYSALAPDAPQLEPLKPYAQTGIPTEAELLNEAPQVASRIAASSSDLPPDAGLLDRLMASARSAVTVRPVGEAEGDTPEAIAARMEAAVQRGDYAQALAEYESLPPKAKEAADDFAEKLRARQAADEVLEKALSSALKPA